MIHWNSLYIFMIVKTNVDIHISAYDTFLEYPSPGNLKIKRLESQII